MSGSPPVSPTKRATSSGNSPNQSKRTRTRANTGSYNRSPSPVVCCLILLFSLSYSTFSTHLIPFPFLATRKRRTKKRKSRKICLLRSSQQLILVLWLKTKTRRMGPSSLSYLASSSSPPVAFSVSGILSSAPSSTALFVPSANRPSPSKKPHSPLTLPRSIRMPSLTMILFRISSLVLILLLRIIMTFPITPPYPLMHTKASSYSLVPGAVLSVFESPLLKQH